MIQHLVEGKNASLRTALMSSRNLSRQLGSHDFRGNGPTFSSYELVKVNLVSYLPFFRSLSWLYDALEDYYVVTRGRTGPPLQLSSCASALVKNSFCHCLLAFSSLGVDQPCSCGDELLISLEGMFGCSVGKIPKSFDQRPRPAQAAQKDRVDSPPE
jgi:hypothetical protein